MRVQRTLLALAAASLITGCSERAELLAPGDEPALDGGIHTIGSNGKDGDATVPTSGSTPDSVTLKGIHTIGSNG